MDLLLFCDRQDNELESPLTVLLERRPDLQHLPLTCENTNTPLPYIDVVNETLRRGLESRRATAQRRAFKVTARDLGNLKPGLSLDNIAELIEHVEGSLHR